MQVQRTTFPRCISIAIALVMVLTGIAASAPPAVAHQEPAPSAVDLAAVPVHPADFPERGYQLAQAGDIELGALQYAWSGDGINEEEWQPIAGHYVHGHAAVHILLSDRADPLSEPLAYFTTTIVGLDSPDAAEAALDTFLGILDIDQSGEVNGVTVVSEEEGHLGLVVKGSYVVIVRYSFPEQQFSTRQDTEDWTPESVAGLTLRTAERLQEALAAAEDDEESLGVANVMVYGPDAGWTISWPFFPNTEHYRVLDGEIVPYGGELDSDARDALPPGIDDLFVSRQQLGDEGYDHLIDVTLARFESEGEAATFAERPFPLTFPPTWQFDVGYSHAQALDNGARLERARADSDELLASGYRTVRREGNMVQVVQWLASGNAVVNREAMVWLTDRQSACLDALPEPCAPLAQDDLPATLDSGDIAPGATPVAGLGEGNVLASPQFGWQVRIPDDGWEIIEAELFTNAEYFGLQSGRSLVTVESVVDRHGDPQLCVLDNLALLEEFEERAVIELGSDDPDERAAGIEQDHGWAIYTVEPLQAERADQEYVIRYDCYTLVPGEASLVVTHTAPRELWTTEREKGNRFRAGIELPESSANMHITPPEGDGRHIGRTLAMGISRIWIPLAA